MVSELDPFTAREASVLHSMMKSWGHSPEAVIDYAEMRTIATEVFFSSGDPLMRKVAGKWLFGDCGREN